MNREDRNTIEKLKAQRNAVSPRKELLHAILSEIPTETPVQTSAPAYVPEKHPHAIPWLRFAFPTAGIAVFLFGIFIISQLPSQQGVPSQTQPLSMFTNGIKPVPSGQALSIASITKEEENIEEQITFEDFFEQEQQLQEAEAILAEF
jgi:hypothetical protein